MMESILILSAVLLGVFSQRIVGFGMPIIVLPVSLIFFEPTSALVIALLTGIFSSIVVVYQLKSKTEFDFRIIKSIIPFSIIGIIIGAYTLTAISKEALQIFLGISIIVSLNIQRYFLPKPKDKIKVDKKTPIYGLFSGFFVSTVGLAAAPLIIWARLYIVRPNQIRMLMAYSFIIMNVISVVTIQIFENKTMTNIPIYIFVSLVPAILIANYLGSIVSNKVDETFYDPLVYFVLMLAGVLTLIKGMGSYF